MFNVDKVDYDKNEEDREEVVRRSDEDIQQMSDKVHDGAV